MLCYENSQLLSLGQSSLELRCERSGREETQSAVLGKGIWKPTPEAVQGEGWAALGYPAQCCLRHAARCWCIDLGQGHGWASLLLLSRTEASPLPSLLLFLLLPLFSSPFPLCPARVFLVGSAAPQHTQSFARLSGQALSTLRGVEGKVDLTCNSYCTSFRDAGRVYRSCQIPRGLESGIWIRETRNPTVPASHLQRQLAFGIKMRPTWRTDLAQRTKANPWTLGSVGPSIPGHPVTQVLSLSLYLIIQDQGLTWPRRSFSQGRSLL